MCFSATASFTAAAVTGTAGLAALSRVRSRVEAPLAAMPLLFGVQQAIEGVIWLTLPTGGITTSDSAPALVGFLIFTYLVFAQPLWPFWGPMAAWLAEPPGQRRRAMGPFVVAGALLAAFLVFSLATRDVGARIMHDHIVYETGHDNARALVMVYLFIAATPLLIARERLVAAFGALLVIGAFATWYAAAHSFQSVWCFFAAPASILIAVHFWLRDRAKPAPATA